MTRARKLAYASSIRDARRTGHHRKFLNIGEAKLAQGKAVSAGISAFVCDENTAMNLHIGMAIGGIRLQVPDSQVVRALEMLDDFVPDATEEEAETEEVPCCPECESLEIREIAKPIPARSRCGRRPFRFPSLQRRPRTAGGAWPADISGGRRGISMDPETISILP